MTHRLACTALAVVLLAGCAAGPDFRGAPAIAVDSYSPQPLSPTTVQAPVTLGQAQTFQPGATVDVRWWGLFGSPVLDRLVQQALEASPTVQAAEAALRAARETTRAQAGALLPQAGVSLQSSRQRTPDAAGGPPQGDNPYALHTGQLSISYVPDLFGATRRAVEGLQAQAEAQRQQLAAARISLTTNVVVTAVQIASLRGQLTATRESLTIARDQLDILQRQLKLGAVAEAAVIAQQGTVAQVEAQLPGLERQLTQQEHQLAVLCGQAPGAMPAPALELADLHLPQQLPVSLPSELARQRPDILAAQAQLHAASAQVGVATAALYPQLTLTAALGGSSAQLASLLAGSSSLWSVAAGVVQPVFQGGSLQARRRAAEAGYEQALAQYKSTVLSALQNVADSLQALHSDAQSLLAATRVEESARRSLEIARRQVELGDASYLALLTFSQAYQQARLATLQAQAARLSDTAALFQALGGGWEAAQAQASR